MWIKWAGLVNSLDTLHRSSFLHVLCDASNQLVVFIKQLKRSKTDNVFVNLLYPFHSLNRIIFCVFSHTDWLNDRQIEMLAVSKRLISNAPKAVWATRHCLVTSYPLYRFLVDFRFSSQFLRDEDNRHVCVTEVLSNLFVYSSSPRFLLRRLWNKTQSCTACSSTATCWWI